MLFNSRKLCFQEGDIRSDPVLLLTPVQINWLDKAQVEGRLAQICMSARQVARNVCYTGVFLGMLASLASCQNLQLVYFLVVLTKRLVGMDSICTKMINAIKHRNGKTIAFCLAPHPHLVGGDGLFVKHGNDISDGAGLLMGKNSLFKNIPVLGWLL